MLYHIPEEIAEYRKDGYETANSLVKSAETSTINELIDILYCLSELDDVSFLWHVKENVKSFIIIGDVRFSRKSRVSLEDVASVWTNKSVYENKEISELLLLMGYSYISYDQRGCVFYRDGRYCIIHPSEEYEKRYEVRRFSDVLCILMSRNIEKIILYDKRNRQFYKE